METNQLAEGFKMSQWFTTILKVPYMIYMKIAEPRVKRIIYFGIYIALATAGAGALVKPPAVIEHILGGQILIYMFASFIVVGCLIGAVSVLPGIWWFERVGLLAIGTGIAMYVIVLLFLGASALVTIIPIILILILVLRWLDIKEYLLAPREE